MSAVVMRRWRTCCSPLLASLRSRFPLVVGPQQRLFTTAAAPGEATPSAAGAAADAFPFLQKQTAAEAAQPVSFGSLAASMASASAGRVRVIRDMDAFEAEVYKQPPTPGSLAASMASASAGRVRVIRDMDAFEAEVYKQPPTPLAIFFAATFNTHNKTLLEQFITLANSSNPKAQFLIVDVDEVPRAAYHCGPTQLIGEFRTALDECLNAVQQKEPPQQRVEWYTHSIPVDNLNVYRVNWPTA
ncbi:RNA-binding protein, putative [Eimeria mitis]|uniref:RNA-binding protein, putative n=1 Tax=Eimeria mitis TaxID=44415 RepID=U6JY13_9EIME|nr:RNA-binding protein, putative [Eimeria mitis]CDJ30350.1 RNA-binding protein, putative [Eimeria mitis]